MYLLHTFFFFFQIEIDVFWTDKIMNGSIVLNSCLKPSMNLNTIFVFNSFLEDDYKINFYIVLKNFHFKIYSLVFKLEKKNLLLKLIKNDKCLFVLKGNITKINNKVNLISGSLLHHKASKTFVIRGFTKYESINFRLIDVFIIPIIQLRELNSQAMKFKLKTEEYGLKFEGSNQEIKGNAEINYLNCLNWDIDFEIFNKNNEQYNLLMYMNTQINRNTTIYFELAVPKHKIDKLILECNLVPIYSTGTLNLKYESNENKKFFSSSWRFFHSTDILVDVHFKKNLYMKIPTNFHFEIFFRNPRKSFQNISSGVKIFIHKLKWIAGSKLTLMQNYQNNFHVFSNVRFLATDEDTHIFNFSCHSGNIYKDLAYVVSYMNTQSNSNYKFDGLVSKFLCLKKTKNQY